MVKRAIDGSDLGSQSEASADSTQTLVFIRHGEKPAQNLACSPAGGSIAR
jgi:hypothetical protein